jgi:DNA repair exonuclease SbcCD ATPase subunit
MNIDTNLIEELRARVQELEDKVEALRISRRVLMNLIDSIEKEKREQLTKLETKNEKLQKNNLRYARAVMNSNIRITELEKQIQALNTGNNKTGNTFT